MSDPLLEEAQLQDVSALGFERRGLRAAARGDHRTAVQAFRKTVDLDPERDDARHNLAVALRRLGRHVEAEEVVGEALERNPNHAPSLILKANLYLDRNQVAEATELLSLAARADPGSAVAPLRLGMVWMSQEQPARAIEPFSRAAQIDPARSEARLGLALAHHHSGATERALVEARSALEAFPASDRLRWALVRLLLESSEGQASRAQEIYDRGSTAADSVERAETLAMIHATMGRYPEAAATQQRAVSLARPGPSRMRAERRLEAYRNHTNSERLLDTSELLDPT